MEKIPQLHVLEECGLTRNEAVVYLELLRTGSTIAKNITKITNMHRTSVYNCLQRLQKKGLVSEITFDKVTHYEAAEPEKLLALVKEREDQLKLILPELKKLKETKFYTKHEVRYFKGKQGLKTVFEDILNTGNDYVGWGPEKKIESLLKYYFIYYVRTRQEKKIHAKMIYSEDSKRMAYTKNPLVEVRFLPKLFYYPTAHRVYGDKVAIILLEEDPRCILIDNKVIADSYRKQFNVLWKIAKPA